MQTPPSGETAHAQERMVPVISMWQPHASLMSPLNGWLANDPARGL